MLRVGVGAGEIVADCVLESDVLRDRVKLPLPVNVGVWAGVMVAD